MKIPSIFKKKQEKQPWQQYWPSCKSPETLSFRACNDEDVVVKDHDHDNDNDNEYNFHDIDHHENYKQLSFDQMVISGVRLSERLFFEANETSSILHEKESRNVSGFMFPFEGSVVLELESENPYLDFKKSMQEMVESQLRVVILKDDNINWDCLEELLGWYLRMNAKITHCFIVEAFVDLLIGLASK